jgi:uncharacterized damage-inducible protein DinB
MIRTQAIVDELRNIHDGEAWHGPSLRALLSGLTAEQAACKPLPHGHSIWELVLHIAGWEDVFTRRLAGIPLSEPYAGDFPPITDASEAAWQTALTQLDATHRTMLDAIAGLSADQLQATVAGKDYSVDYLLSGIVRHHVYHAGQIALLRNQENDAINRGKPPPRKCICNLLP